MIIRLILTSGVLVLSLGQCWSQGTFVYDQQSASSTIFAEGGPNSIKNNQPLGQSFTPSLSAVGFVQFYYGDSSSAPYQGSSLNVIMRSDSITGPILGTSESVNIAGGTSGAQTFLFDTPISVTPGTTYYFQPLWLSGDDQGISYEFAANYTGGTAFVNGSSVGADLWFREGILVVPEPSTWTLLLLGASAWCLFRRRR